MARDLLFISWLGKHQAVTKTTVARWLKAVLQFSGIDNRFGAHSTRSAAVSAASSAGLSAKHIMEAANWAPGGSTFEKFYHRSVGPSLTRAVLFSKLPVPYEL